MLRKPPWKDMLRNFWLSDRSKRAFPIIKVSVISSKGAFNIKELQVFQANLQINRISEYFDLTASWLIVRFFRFPSSSNKKQLLSAEACNSRHTLRLHLSFWQPGWVRAHVRAQMYKETGALFFTCCATALNYCEQENNTKPELLPRWDDHSRYKCAITFGCQEDKRRVAARVCQ